MDWDQAKLVGLVALGGALGSVVRYAASGYVTRGDFPWGTFFVNLTGNFLLATGFFLAMGRGFRAADLRAFAFIGIFGGYTTCPRSGSRRWACSRMDSSAGPQPTSS